MLTLIYNLVPLALFAIVFFGVLRNEKRVEAETEYGSGKASTLVTFLLFLWKRRAYNRV